jgi:hypothetical protein
MTLRTVPVLLLWSVLGLWMTVHASCPDPADPPERGKPPLPGKSCAAAALDDWTPQEYWVWANVCEGYIADFNKAKEYGGMLDPTKPDNWPETRILRQAFLETILLYEPWRGMVPRQGVRIFGAWFKEPLDLSDAEIKHGLGLYCSRFEERVILLWLRAARSLSLEGSVFKGSLNMSGIRVEDALFLRHAHFTDVNLRAAHIGAQLSLIGAIVTGKLTMESLEVKGPLLMRKAKIAEGDATKSADLAFVDIGSTLDLSGATLPSLDLAGSHIGGALRLAQKPLVTKWQSEATIILRSVTAGSVQDAHNAWPNRVELDGFTYGRLSGFTVDKTREVMSPRDSEWFIRWLAKQTDYSSQPYEYLAKILREEGRQDAAKEILHAGKERERSIACRSKNPKEPDACDLSELPWLWLSILKVFIGYGHYPFKSACWAIGATILGVFVLRASRQNQKHKMKYWGLAYSIDMLLPIIELRKYHSDKIDLEGWVRVYFYCHQIFGYVLALFLVAGLTGLAK